MPHNLLSVSSMSHCPLVLCLGKHICICRAPHYSCRVVGIYTYILKKTDPHRYCLFSLQQFTFTVSCHFMTNATDTTFWNYINSIGSPAFVWTESIMSFKNSLLDMKPCLSTFRRISLSNDTSISYLRKAFIKKYFRVTITYRVTCEKKKRSIFHHYKILLKRNGIDGISYLTATTGSRTQIIQLFCNTE